MPYTVEPVVAVVGGCHAAASECVVVVVVAVDDTVVVVVVVVVVVAVVVVVVVVVGGGADVLVVDSAGRHGLAAEHGGTVGTLEKPCCPADPVQTPWPVGCSSQNRSR